MAESNRVRSWLTRWAPLVLVALPVALYWSGISQRFGLRDDYANLREAHEQPGWLLHLCASQGRPVYGFLLEHSYAVLDGIDSFRWVRLTGTLLWGTTAALLLAVLTRQLAWRLAPAVALAAVLVTLPGVQVETHWGVCWPHALAGTLGVLAFACAEVGWRTAGTACVWRLAAAGGLLWTAMLMYPPDALLFVVAMAAQFAGAVAQPWRERWTNLVRHGALVGATLVLAFATIKVLSANGVFPTSSRVAIEWDWAGKLAWFAAQPLRQSLALFVLADDAGRTAPWYQLAALATALALTTGFVVEWRRRGAVAAGGRFAGWCALVLLAYAVSFVASERWATYRTLIALSGVLLVFLITPLMELRRGWRGATALVGLAAVAIAGGWAARHNSRLYLAEAQVAELQRIETAADRIGRLPPQRVFLLLPEPWDSTCAVSHLDEFGSLSGDCEWAAKEMLERVLLERQRVAKGWNEPREISTHYVLPTKRTYDVLVDLRTHS
ncbi:MAG TPA: hypothetical protein VK178_08865 [Opitutaceae bacterium]|nr:hypothetical protein [Opitutaceae bacterium]